MWRKKTLKMSTITHVLTARTLKKHADNLRRLSGTKPHSIEKHGVARHRKAVNVARITRLRGVYMVIIQ